MNELLHIAEKALSLMKAADKSQCVVTRREKHEVNAESGKLTLMRSSFENSVSMSAITQSKRGALAVASWEPEKISETAAGAIELALAGQPDPAYDIAACEDGENDFCCNSPTAGGDEMVALLDAMNDAVKERMPYINHDTTLCYVHTETLFANSNGVCLSNDDRRVSASSLFSAKRGEQVSSLNYIDVELRRLPEQILELCGLSALMEQSLRELDASPLGGKFEGDVILTPFCLNETLNAYINAFLSDRALITGTSMLKDKLGQPVAADTFNLYTKPLSPELCGYRITSDGYRAADMPLIESGVLKNHILSLYGANKTGGKRSASLGSCLEMPAGTQSLEELIAGVKRGVLVGRISGGMPSDNGDFSGVAKNSFLIEDGRVTRPLQETMLSGNSLSLLKCMTGLSRERVNSGSFILPWFRACGVVFS